jgi:hypothetical protein
MRAFIAACALLVGCATTRPEAVPLGPGEVLSAKAATDSIAVGKSTKADVRAALGEATVIDFVSGYEVWVYRERSREKTPPPGTELVLLFEPSGVLTKTRVR